MDEIIFIKIPENLGSEINGFFIDPSIPIPLEKDESIEEGSLENLSWEKIIAAMLKILAFHRDFAHTDYYRQFICAVRPDLIFDLIDAGTQKAENQDLDTAEEIFLAAEGLDPDNITCLISMALLYEQKAALLDSSREKEKTELYEKSFELYKRALLLDPLDLDAHYYTGCFYINRLNHEKGTEHLKKYLELADDIEKISERALKAQKIIKDFEACTELDLLFREAYDMIQLCREEEGIEKIKTFLERNPDVWNGWFLLGWGYRRTGNFSDGYKAFMKVLELGERSSDVLNEAALCSIELGRKKDALKYLEEALKKEPENTKIISNLGMLYYRNSDPETAEKYFLSALEYDKSDPVALKYLDIIKNSSQG